MMFAGLIILCGLIVVMYKLRLSTLRRLLAFEIYLDIASFVIIKAMLFGTYSGMMSAFVGGLLFSAVLFVTKRAIGWDELEKTTCNLGHTHRIWVAHDGVLIKREQAHG